MLIVKHDKSHIVELEDGSRWRIWPGDIAATLQWLPTTDLQVVAIDDEFCSHALVDQTDGSRVGVIDADGLACRASPTVSETRVSQSAVDTLDGLPRRYLWRRRCGGANKSHHYFVARRRDLRGRPAP